MLLVGPVAALMASLGPTAFRRMPLSRELRKIAQVALRMWRDVREKGEGCGVHRVRGLWASGCTDVIHRAASQNYAVRASGWCGPKRYWHVGGAILAPDQVRITRL